MITIPREEWMADAACPETDPDLFFPERNSRGLDAKAICRLCAVEEECLAYAMAHPEVQGVWGGTNDADRRRRRKEAASA